jgi:DNA-binding NtrC family response regulator
MSFTILIVEDEDDARGSISRILTKKGYLVLEAGTLTKAKEIYRNNIIDIVILDHNLPDGKGLTLLEEPIEDFYKPRVIVTTGQGNIKMAVEAMRNGAHDFIEKPINFDYLLDSIKKAEDQIRIEREVTYYNQTFETQGIDYVISSNSKMKRVFEAATRAAKNDATTIIYGESGTGKEIIARHIYNNSPRKGNKFIAINSAGLNKELMATQLFGHEEGAFTDARKRHIGSFEHADGGILFLDEISRMDLDVQERLLRTLDNKLITRMNGHVEIPVDVQIVFATNKDLGKMVEEGKMAEDFLFRISVFPIVVPPLRDHLEDVPDLVGHFIKKNNEKGNKMIEGITDRALSKLMKFNYPGNIRELQHIIERAIIYCDVDKLDVHHFDLGIQNL